MKQNTHISIFTIDGSSMTFKRTEGNSIYYRQFENFLQISEVGEHSNLLHHYPWHIIKAWHVTEQVVSLDKEGK
jgi:hypothetical protein